MKMVSHIDLPRIGRRYRGALAALALSLLVGCGGSKPQVHVIGVAPEGEGAASDSRVVVFLEVVNRTGRELELSRLNYQLSASAWFDAEGDLVLRRHVDEDSSVVVEIPVDLARTRTGDEVADDDIAYQLKGRLRARDVRDDRMERSWKVESSGQLRAKEGDVGKAAVRVRVAAGE